MTTTRHPVIACALSSNENLTAVQKVLIEYAYLYPNVPKAFGVLANVDAEILGASAIDKNGAERDGEQKENDEENEQESDEEKQEQQEERDGEQESVEQLLSSKIEATKQQPEEQAKNASSEDQPIEDVLLQSQSFQNAPNKPQNFLGSEYLSKESIQSEIQ